MKKTITDGKEEEEKVDDEDDDDDKEEGVKLCDLSEHGDEGIDARQVEGHGHEQLVEESAEEEDEEDALTSSQTRAQTGEVQMSHLQSIKCARLSYRER